MSVVPTRSELFSQARPAYKRHSDELAMMDWTAIGAESVLSQSVSTPQARLSGGGLSWRGYAAGPRERPIEVRAWPMARPEAVTRRAVEQLGGKAIGRRHVADSGAGSAICR